MGSGSVGVAALQSGRRLMGNDLNPEAVKIAGGRFARIEPPAASDSAAPVTSKDRPADLLSLFPDRR
jgi:DNA modification methylase